MRKPSIAQLVYNASFPHPRTTDPSSFAAHVARNLVPEVRLETDAFYGSLSLVEAQYPGLDYSFAPHRVRLGRFTWHRRLFKVFDRLQLTRQEILELCTWEGTLSARKRYEEEEELEITDVLIARMPHSAPCYLPTATVHDDFCGPEDDDQDQLIETGSDDTVRASDTRSSSVMSDYRAHELDQDSDDEVESCGVALNNRLMAASAARDQGVDVPLDEDYEQWLKEAGERGGYGDMVHAIRSNQPLSLIPEAPTSDLRHETENGEETLLPMTISAEAFLAATSSLFASSPAVPQSDNSEAAQLTEQFTSGSAL